MTDPVVGIVMGSDSDWPMMEPAAEALGEFDVPYEVHVVSAHRTPRRMLDYAESAAGRGLRVVVAGAGGAAHLPGMVAAAPTMAASPSGHPSTARRCCSNWLVTEPSIVQWPELCTRGAHSLATNPPLVSNSSTASTPT